jgi:hypothetical protein
MDDGAGARDRHLIPEGFGRLARHARRAHVPPSGATLMSAPAIDLDRLLKLLERLVPHHKALPDA